MSQWTTAYLPNATLVLLKVNYYYHYTSSFHHHVLNSEAACTSMTCVQHWQYFLVGLMAVLVWVGWGVVGGLVWLVSDPDMKQPVVSKSCPVL
jgi:hypothetical protein